jgi:hypothetical protein
MTEPMVEFEIEIQDSASRALLEKEMAELIESAFGKDIPTIKIVVTSDFEASVRKLVPEESGEKYRAHHGYAIAYAKTIPQLENNQLHFVIIFDARLFNDMSTRFVLARQAKIIHELVHVRNGLLRFQSVGASFFTKPQSKLDIGRANAWGIWEDYEAERTVADVLTRGVDQDATIHFNETLGFADDVIKDLQVFESFMVESVRDFQEQQIDLTSLTRVVTERVVGMLLRLTYVYAVGEVSDEVRQKTSEIEGDTTYNKFFASGWRRILLFLREHYANRPEFHSDIIDKIAGVYDDILVNCGVDIEDAPNGFRVRLRRV